MNDVGLPPASACEEALRGIHEALQSDDSYGLSRHFRALAMEAHGASESLDGFFDTLEQNPAIGAKIMTMLLGQAISVTTYLEKYKDFLRLYFPNRNERDKKKGGGVLHEERTKEIESSMKSVVVDTILRTKQYSNLRRRLEAGKPLFFSDAAYLAFIGLNPHGYRRKEHRSVSIDMLPRILTNLETKMGDEVYGRRNNKTCATTPRALSFQEVLQSVNEVVCGEDRDEESKEFSDASDTDDEQDGAFRGVSRKRRKKTKTAARKSKIDRALSRFKKIDGSLDWLPLLTREFKSTAVPRLISKEESASLLLMAASAAYPQVVRAMRTWGLQMDELLCSGGYARQLMGLDPFVSGKTTNRTIMEANCTPLVAKRQEKEVYSALSRDECFFIAAPMVVDIKNAYSSDFHKAYEKTLDRLSYDRCGSNAGSSNLRASFKQENESEEGPLVRVGQHFIQAVPAEKGAEEALMDLHSEFSNLFADATREEMRSFLQLPEPEGYIGWREFYSQRVEAIKNITAEASTEEERHYGLEALRVLGDRNMNVDMGVYEESLYDGPVSGNHNEPKKRKRSTIPLDGGSNIVLDGSKEKDMPTTPQHGVRRSKRFVTPSPMGVAVRKRSAGRMIPVHEKKKRELFEAAFRKSLVPAKYDSLVFRCGLHLYKIGNAAAYGRHRDISFILNSPSQRKARRLNNGMRLPTSEEMVVTTTCICSEDFVGYTSLQHWLGKEQLSNIKTYGCHIHHQGPFTNSGDYEHSSERHLPDVAMVVDSRRELKHGFLAKNGGDDEDKEMDALDMAAANGATPNLLQPAEGKALGPSAERGVRAVITSRMIAVPCRDRDAYYHGIREDGGGKEKLKKESVYCHYKETGVFTGRREVDGGGTIYAIAEEVPPISTGAVASAKTSDVSRRKCTEIDRGSLKFGWLSAQEQSAFHEYMVSMDKVLPGGDTTAGERRLGIELPQQYTQMRQRRAEAAITCSVVEHFLLRNELLSIVLCEENQKVFGRETYEPLLAPGGTPLLPGKIINCSNVSFIKKNKRAKPVIDAANPQHGVAMEHTYKSVLHTIDLHFHFHYEFHQFRNGDDPDNPERIAEFAEWHNKLPPLETSGSGGSATPPGAQPLSASSSGPFDCHHTTPANQIETSPENQALMLLCRRETPVSAVFNMAHFLAPSNKRRTDRDSMDDRIPGRNKELNDMIHAANLFVNGIIERAKDKPLNDKMYYSLGFFEIESYRIVRAKSLKEVQLDFSEIPDYVERNKSYTSYKWEKNLRFVLAPAFKYETLLHITKNQGCSKYKKLYLPDDNLKLKATIPAIQEHAKKMLPEEEGKAEQRAVSTAGVSRDFPVEYVTTKTMVDYLLGLDDTEFGSQLGVESQKEQVKAAFRPLYGFSTEEWFHAMTAMQLCVAVRSDKKNCTRRNAGEGGNGTTREYAIPLICRGSYDLPSTLRASDHPSPNMDYDLGNAFFRDNGVKLTRQRIREKPVLKLQELQGDVGANQKGWKNSFVNIDLTNDSVVDLVAEMIFMSAAFRFTGDVPHMSLFGEYLKVKDKTSSGLSLPVPDNLSRYFSFLDDVTTEKKFSADLGSEQFGNLIDPVFKDMKKYKSFLTALGSTEDGGGLSNIRCAIRKLSVEDDVGRNNADWDARTQFLEYLMREFKDCSGAEADKHMKFACHKVMCDVESVLLGVFGEVTLKSLGFGPGSDFGLQVLTRGPGQRNTSLEDWDGDDERAQLGTVDDTEKTTTQDSSEGLADSANNSACMLDHVGKETKRAEPNSGDGGESCKVRTSKTAVVGMGVGTARAKKKSKAKFEDRKQVLFEVQHVGMQKYLLRQKNEYLLLLGWTKHYSKNGSVVLRSIRTGRLYSRADTEHMFCKLYICTAMAHPSRNSGKRRQAHSAHCWPTMQDSDWQIEPKEEMSMMWETYLRLLETEHKSGYFRVFFPRTLRYADPHYLNSGKDKQHWVGAKDIGNRSSGQRRSIGQRRSLPTRQSSRRQSLAFDPGEARNISEV